MQFASSDLGPLAKSLTLALLCTAAGTSAQVNDADRLARCENNRNALAAIEARPRPQVVYSAAEIGDIRSVLVNLRRLRREMRENNEHPSRAFTEILIVNERILNNVQRWGKVARVQCSLVDAGCPDRMIARIERAIDESLVEHSIGPAEEEQAARYRTNLIALNCDGAAPAAYPAASAAGTAAQGIPSTVDQWPTQPAAIAPAPPPPLPGTPGYAGGRVKLKPMSPADAAQMAQNVTSGLSSTQYDWSLTGEWTAPTQNGGREVLSLSDVGGQLVVSRGSQVIAAGRRQGTRVELRGAVSGSNFHWVGQTDAAGKIIDWGSGSYWHRR